MKGHWIQSRLIPFFTDSLTITIFSAVILWLLMFNLLP